jgi:hypothetical protein
MIVGSSPSTLLLKAAPMALLCVVLACGKDDAQIPAQAGDSPPTGITQGPTIKQAAPPMDAVQVSSRVVFPDAPDDPHSIQLTLANEGFGRLKLASDPEVQGRRVLQHFYDGELYETAPRSSKSVQLEGLKVLETLTWFGMRRALYDWDGGRGWEKNPSQPLQLILPRAEHRPIIALLDSNTGLPTTLSHRLKDGTGLLAFTNLEWSTEVPTPKILAFQVEHTSGVLWQESKVRIRKGLSMRASFFLPADRRPKSGRPVVTTPATK